MLKPKLKTCKGCGKEKVLWSRGMCMSCTPSKPLKATKPIKANSILNKRARPKGMMAFFKSQEERFRGNPISFESGRYIPEISTVNLAHIFPKEIYKSLAQEPSNIILLTWEEHTKFDELLFKHEFDKLDKEFKSWGKICSLIKELIPLCKEEGKLKQYLIKYLETYKIK